jgi:ribosomal protein L39E
VILIPLARRCLFLRPIAIGAILGVLLIAFPQRAMAQDPSGALVNILYQDCLKKKFPHIIHSAEKWKAFDPDSGHNFVYDKSIPAWVDTKTGRAVCPDAEAGTSGALVNWLYQDCLKKKFPHIIHSAEKWKAFDPDSGHNFVYDKSVPAWVDTKTGKCVCPTCEHNQTAQAPAPSTTDKVTDVLKTIGSSVSIGIGGGRSGGGDHRHGGEDRHRTADKVSTDKTKTHTTSPTTSKKTVTAGCKCHPCTCSPCTCH